MTITHSEVLSPVGARVPVTSAVAGPGRGGRVELLQWSTQGGEVQELEIVVYPVHYGEPELEVLDLVIARSPVFEKVRIDMRWSVGGGGSSNSPEFRTMQASTVAPYPKFAQASLPDHGIKFRMVCRSMQLALIIEPYNDINFIALGTVTPVIGGAMAPPFPYVNRLSSTPELIPIGAREFRVSPIGRGHPTPGNSLTYREGLFGLLKFYRNTDEAAYGFPLDARGVLPLSACTEWQTLPGTAVSVGTLGDPDATGTIEYR